MGIDSLPVMESDNHRFARPVFWILPAILLALASLVSWRAAAESVVFRHNGVDLSLEAGGERLEVFYRNLRPSVRDNEWRAELELKNVSLRTVDAPIVLTLRARNEVGSVLNADGIDEQGNPYVVLDSLNPENRLRPGEVSDPFLVRFPFDAGLAPDFEIRAYLQDVPRNYAIGVVQTLDASGQLLPGVSVHESKSGAGLRITRTDTRFGWETLGTGAGEYTWRFEKEHYLPAWRRGRLQTGEVLELTTPKLQRREPMSFRLSPLNGATYSTGDGSIQIEFPGGSFPALGAGRLTRLSDQALPASLPLGWVPLGSFWLELDQAPTLDGLVRLRSAGWGGFAGQAYLVRWDETVWAWLLEENGVVDGSEVFEVPVGRAGAYALVVPDRVGTVPSIPVLGEAISGPIGLFDSFDGITATGEVAPSVVAASTNPNLVTASATVVFEHPSTELVSGMTFSCRVRESYVLQNGNTRSSPAYSCSLVAYRLPSGSDGRRLYATFPLRPQLLLGADELVEATVQLEVSLPRGFGGEVLCESGGVLGLERGIQLEVAPGQLSSDEAIRLRSLSVADFAEFADEGLEGLAAFELTMGELDLGERLRLSGISEEWDGPFVLGRILSRDGVYGIEPVERLLLDAGLPVSLESSSDDGLPGIDRSGQYILFQTREDYRVLKGVALDETGAPAEGMILEVEPFKTLSDTSGAYRLLARLEPATLKLLDPRNGNTAIASLENTTPDEPVTLQARARGPVVTRIEPADGETRVSTIAAITVDFNEPVLASTVIGEGLVLADESGERVPVSVSLNSRNTRLTLYPVEPLAYERLYVVRLAESISDPTGALLEGQNEYRFTTLLPPTRGAGGQLVIYEPGATDLPDDVANNLVGYDPETNPFVVAVEGTQGAADPEVPVVITNESTGETATVLSKVDGSFYSFINGTEDDFVSATYVNRNGSRIYLPVSRQEFDNGFVGLYPQGGILEAESDGGEVEVLVEPGSIDNKSKLRLQTVDLLKLMDLLEGVQPEGGGQVLGGMVLSAEGDETPDSRAELSFEVKPEALPLDQGVAPEDATWGLAIPREYDGVTTYEIIDSMSYVDGKLVTQGLADRLSSSSSNSALGLQRLRNATVTPGGIVSEQLRPPISIGILFEAISAAQRGSKRANALDLSNEVLGALGLPSIGDTIKHQLLLPIMMAQGTSVGVGGVVKAVTVDDQGRVSDSDSGEAMVGALVMVDQGPLSRRPGRLRPGIMYASTSEKGEYAFNIPITLDNSQFILTATHPRYPFQVANGGATVASLADRFSFGNFANVPLFFAQGDFFDAGPTGDTVDPVIRAAHEPQLPASGTGDDDGVVLTAVGLDNGTMANVTVTHEKVINLGTGLEEELDTVSIEEISDNDASETQSNSLTKRFRIKSEKRARVTLKITAVDQAGRTADVPYLINFGGEPISVTPVDTTDQVKPRVVFAWPPEGAVAQQPGKPIWLRFSESLPEESFGENQTSWLTFQSHQVISAEPSKDFKEVLVHYAGPTTGSVELSIMSGLVDRNGNSFDQNPDEDGDQFFTLSFELASSPVVDLPEAPVSGGGVVFHGAHAFAIEREGDQDGAVFAYDVSDPADPRRVGSISVPGYPTALAMLPDYSMQQGPSGTCATGDYLAVAGGRSGFEGPPKYLWIIDVSSPEQPGRVSGAVITFSDTARISGMQWSPPFLGVLIAEGGITSLQVINVPEMVYGLTATSEEVEQFSSVGGAGVDENRDGDYCDDQDEPPIPSSKPDQLFGMVVTLSPPDPNERILDFAVDSESGVIGVVYHVPGGGSGYRTLFAGLELVDSDTAAVGFGAADFPKRLIFLPGTAVEEEVDGETTINFKNLALVSIAGSPNRLALLDLSNPTEPTLVHNIHLPSGSGIPQSLRRRGDGLVVVATPGSMLLLDPSQLMQAEDSGGHPAFVGNLVGIGSNTKKYVADTSGINVTSSGGNSQLALTAPQFQLLSFPDEPGTVSEIIAMDDEERAELLLKGRESEFLVPARFESPAQSTNITAATSYYVFVNAPGGFGDEIPMSLVSLDRRGRMLRQSKRSEMPRLLTDMESYETLTGETNTTAMGTSPGQSDEEEAEAESSFKTDFMVKRLAGDSTTSAFYNTYLGGPLVLTRRDLKDEEVSTLSGDDEAARFLRAGRYLWAGIAPKGYNGSNSITNFVSSVSGQTLLPGASKLYQVATPRLPLILIHGVAGSHLEINSEGDVGIINRLRARVFSELWPGYHVFDNVARVLNMPIFEQFSEYVGYAKLLSLAPEDNSGGGGNQSGGEDGGSNQVEVPKVVASDIIREIPERYTGYENSGVSISLPTLKQVYAPLIDYIVDELGYREYRHYKLGDGGFLQTDENTGFHANEFHRLRVVPPPDEEEEGENANSGEGDNKFNTFIKSQVEDHPDFFIFVYDWRLSNVETAKELEKYMELVEYFHPDLEKVNIVAHSMGGMVARRYIMDNPDKVEKLITLGTPFLGAPKSILTLETGEFLDSIVQHAVIMGKAAMRELVKYFPGPHQLVPSSKYWELVPDMFQERGWDYNRNGDAYDAYTFENFEQALDNIRFSEVDSTPAAESESFNVGEDSSEEGGAAGNEPDGGDTEPVSPLQQADWTNDDSDVSYFHIYGVQTAPRTVGKLVATRRIRPSLTSPGYFTFREELEAEYVLGDGTVPLVSASRMSSGGESPGTGGGMNASDAVRIPLVATENTSAANKLVDHNGMNSNPELHQIVGSILNDEFTMPDPANTGGESGGVTTIRVINSEIGSIKIYKQMEGEWQELPQPQVASFAGLAPLDEDDPRSEMTMHLSGVEDDYGVQIYEMDPFRVPGGTDNAVPLPPADDEGNDRPDAFEIVLYGADYRVEVIQDNVPVAIRVEQERNGVVERLMIWNELDGEDVLEASAASVSLMRRSSGGGQRRMVVGSKNAVRLESLSDIETPTRLSMRPLVDDTMDEDDPDTEVDGAPVDDLPTEVDGTPVDDAPTEVDGEFTDVDIAPDTTLEDEAARDITPPSRVTCQAVARNSKYRFFLVGADGQTAQFGRFYYFDTDPSDLDVIPEMRQLEDGLLNVRELIGSIPGNSVWVVGEDPRKNIARSPPIEIPLIYLNWEGQSAVPDAGQLVEFGESDWLGMLPLGRPSGAASSGGSLANDDLLRVDITLEPAGLGEGRVSLGADRGVSSEEEEELKIAVYLDEARTMELDLPQSWDLASEQPPSVLYVAAKEFSENLRDIQLKLEYEPPSDTGAGAKNIATRILLTVPKIVFEPINTVFDESQNAAGLVVGDSSKYVIEVEPASVIPDAAISWESASGRVSFEDPNGREVIATGVSAGVDELSVRLAGFIGYPPSLPLEVFSSFEEVDIYTYVLADSLTGDGRVIDPDRVREFIEEVNPYYEHVGMRFRVAGEVNYFVPPSNVSWNVVPSANNYSVMDDICRQNENKNGLEMYFVYQIQDALGLNYSEPEPEAGILVAVQGSSPSGRPLLTRPSTSGDLLSAATVAHEIGHSCGFDDVYIDSRIDIPNGNRGFVSFRIPFPPTSPPQWDWLPLDWGTLADRYSYYSPDVTYVQIVKRLLMHGFDSGGQERDIPFGPVYGWNHNGQETSIMVGVNGPEAGAGINRRRINRSPKHF